MTNSETNKYLGWAFMGLALLATAYHLLYTQVMVMGPILHQNTHYMLALALVFLGCMKDAKSTAGRVVALALLLLSLFATGYMFVNYDELTMYRGPLFDLNSLDLVVGCLMIGLGLEASRRAFGPVFPIVCLTFIAYAMFGWMLGAPFHAPKISFPELLTSFCMAMDGGIYGQVLGISANYIFLFVVFGGMLGATGALRFFNHVGMQVGSRVAGGPAMTAVVSSSLMGMVTGSAMANVATVGSFTIPLMKKVGYKPHQAGAIEAAASSGGQIMPPVMGATAFVMAEMAETPYVKIMLAAIFPALLYYLSLGIYAQLAAKRLRIDPGAISPVKLDRKARLELMLDAPIFLVPLAIITVLLLMGYSPMFTIFWGMTSLFVLNLLDVWRKGDWRELKKIFPAMASGAVTGAKIGVTCALLGPIITTMTKTGLGLAIPGLISLWCQGSLVLALMITAVVIIILGMGVPTVAAYLMVVMVGVPVLVKLGVAAFSAHMFVFIYAAFACLTPPIAVSAIPAAAIAETSYMRTALEAAKVGVVAFVIPFLVVFAPEILIGQPAAGFFATGGALLVSALSIWFLGVSTTGYCLGDIGWPERILSGCISVAFVAVLFLKSWLVFGLTLCAGAAFMLLQLRRRRLAVAQPGMSQSAV